MPPGHPDGPSSRSVPILARTRKPIDLDHTDSATHLYDPREDVFLDSEGKTVSPVQILGCFSRCTAAPWGVDSGSVGTWVQLHGGLSESRGLGRAKTSRC